MWYKDKPVLVHPVADRAGCPRPTVWEGDCTGTVGRKDGRSVWKWQIPLSIPIGGLGISAHTQAHTCTFSLFSSLSLQLLKYLLESCPILKTQRTSLYLQNIFSRLFEDQERLSQKKNQLGGERETHIMLSSECSFRHSLLHISSFAALYKSLWNLTLCAICLGNQLKCKQSFSRPELDA